MPYPFKNLVFEGGGVKGVAFGGALAVLNKRGILDRIERVGGTSAGAITATMVALGYGVDYIKNEMLRLDFNQFKDGSFLGDVARLFKKYGWYKGETFLEFIEGQIAGRTGSRDTTFDDLHAAVPQGKGFRDLYVVGTDLTTRQYQVFSHESTGGVKIADAVRISMSIPLFFASRTFDNDVFVDGGVLNNYPVTLFDDPRYNHGLAPGDPNPETIGFHLGKQVVRPYPITDLEQYVGNLFETILDVQDDALWNSEDDLRRTVCIDNLGIQTTDFAITMEQREALIRQGHEATANYLRAYDAGERPTVCDQMKRDRRRGR
ncbi:MAG TPA: patatin-like phospholipase family protein [Blastocatellia bacterium]|nr:patatin-like phospholipase family protein [Blastocatellia bacterium]